MSMFRQSVIAAFVIFTALNAWGLIGALGGYKYYGQVTPMDAAGAQQFALWVEAALFVLAVAAWWLSGRKTPQP